MSKLRSSNGARLWRDGAVNNPAQGFLLRRRVSEHRLRNVKCKDRKSKWLSYGLLMENPPEADDLFCFAFCVLIFIRKELRIGLKDEQHTRRAVAGATNPLRQIDPIVASPCTGQKSLLCTGGRA